MPIRILADAETTGTIYGHLFENASAGVKRGLYWSVTCPCAPIHSGGEEWETSLSCEWLTWPLHDWTQLDGAGLVSIIDTGSIECSFYLSEHYPATLMALTLRRILATNRFVVSMSGEVEITGFEELDETVTFSVEFEAELGELVVVPDNLFPKPSTEQEATTALAPFINTANLQAPQWDRFRYVFSPMTPEA